MGAFASEAALRLVGELGDGWHSWLNTTETFRKRWSVISESAQSAGRSSNEIEPATHLAVSFPRSLTEKRKALIAGKATLIVEKTLLREFGYARNPDDYQNILSLSKDDVSKLMRTAADLPDEYVYRTMAIGKLDDIGEKIDELAEVGVKHFAVLDLLGPITTRRTIRMFRRIIRDYSQRS